MPSTRSCDGEAAGCASAAACMRASIVGAAMEDLEKGARETSRESQATHARRQDRPEGWIRRRPNDADWVRNVLLQEASSASGNLRSGLSTLCGGWCRRTANFPTGFRASAVGSPCTDMRAVARHLPVLRRAYAEDAKTWRPLECASHSEHPTSTTRNKGCEGSEVKLLPKCRGPWLLFHNGRRGATLTNSLTPKVRNAAAETTTLPAHRFGRARLAFASMLCVARLARAATRACSREEAALRSRGRHSPASPLPRRHPLTAALA